MKDYKEILWDWKVIILVILSFTIIIFSFFAPNIVINYKENFDSASGYIGDTIGGIMNPLIALSGVFITFLAFYMQLRANQIQIKNFRKDFVAQKKQNRLSQFESQFYEMLRLHKENINEIEIDLYVYSEQVKYSTSNNDHFLSRKKESIESIVNVKQVKGRDVFSYFANELEIAFNIYKNHIKEMVITSNEISYFNFYIPYKAFFYGYETLRESSYKSKLISEKKKSDDSIISGNRLLKEIFLGTSVKARYPLFQGHENKLGHYYRHLYHIVKFVAEENIFLKYKEKRKYLRILRAQLSNYEQAMLFYNYLAFAPEWEEENKFLSDYRMIHNLREETLINDTFFKEEYNKIKALQSVAKSYKENDYIFESQKDEEE